MKALWTRILALCRSGSIPSALAIGLIVAGAVFFRVSPSVDSVWTPRVLIARAPLSKGPVQLNDWTSTTRPEGETNQALTDQDLHWLKGAELTQPVGEGVTLRWDFVRLKGLSVMPNLPSLSALRIPLTLEEPMALGSPIELMSANPGVVFPAQLLEARRDHALIALEPQLASELARLLAARKTLQWRRKSQGARPRAAPASIPVILWNADR